MKIEYISTRGDGKRIQASEAILKGLAGDGGLYVPDKMPHLDKSISELSAMSYTDIAYEVMKVFFTDFTEEELKSCIHNKKKRHIFACHK